MYAGPSAKLRMERWSFELGGMFTTRRIRDFRRTFFAPHGELQLGSKTLFFSASFLNNFPLISSGGFGDFGIGLKGPGVIRLFWMGVAGGPMFNYLLFSFRSRIQLLPTLEGHISLMGSPTEIAQGCGFSFGVEFPFRRLDSTDHLW